MLKEEVNLNQDIKELAEMLRSRSEEILASDKTKKGYNAYQVLFSVSNRIG